MRVKHPLLTWSSSTSLASWIAWNSFVVSLPRSGWSSLALGCDHVNLYGCIFTLMWKLKNYTNSYSSISSCPFCSVCITNFTCNSSLNFSIISIRNCNFYIIFYISVERNLTIQFHEKNECGKGLKIELILLFFSFLLSKLTNQRQPLKSWLQGKQGFDGPFSMGFD